MKHFFQATLVSLFLILTVALYSCKKDNSGIAPTITSFMPDSASIGTSIAIVGTDLATTSAVTFNGVAATISSTTTNSIIVQVPVGATTGVITITTSGGTVSSVNIFKVIPASALAPTITTFTPNSTTALKDTVTITGTNLATATNIYFAGIAGTIVSKNSTTLIAIIPNASITGPVAITTPIGTAISATNITVNSLPAISSFTPSSGDSGTLLTIKGINFTNTTGVSIDSIAVSNFTIVNDSTITAHASTAHTGLIRVITNNGTAISSTDFSFPSSNEVAAGNLVAYWPFDNSTVEQLSGVAASTISGTISYTTGQIGNALNLSNAYLIYPTVANLNNASVFAGGFTLSMWVQLPSELNYTSLFQINENASAYGAIGLAYRKNSNNDGNVFDFNGSITNIDPSGAHSTNVDDVLEYPQSNFAFNTEWAFITMVYDTTARSLLYYGNGTLIGSEPVANTIVGIGEAFQIATSGQFPNLTNQVSFGTLDVSPAFPNSASSIASWMSTGLTGSIDDVRLFNTALSQTNITALYTRGLAGN